MTGALALGAVMMALYVRERTGEGQRIDASLLGGATAMQFGRLMWASDSEPVSEVEDALNDRIARVYEVSGRTHLSLHGRGWFLERNPARF